MDWTRGITQSSQSSNVPCWMAWERRVTIVGRSDSTSEVDRVRTGLSLFQLNYSKRCTRTSYSKHYQWCPIAQKGSTRCSASRWFFANQPFVISMVSCQCLECSTAAAAASKDAELGVILERCAFASLLVVLLSLAVIR